MTETLETTETPEEPLETPETPDEDDDGDEDTEDEDEPQETPETPQDEPSPASDPEVWKKLERSASTWRNRVSELLGEDAQELLICPLCPDNLPGLLLPIPPDEQTIAEVEAFLHPVKLPEMAKDPDTEECDLCVGIGEVLTGSKVPGKDKKLCPKCNGNGWTDPTARSSWNAVHPPASPSVSAPAYQVSPPGAAWSPPATDNWGRPYGNANYGRDPQTMSPEDRAADPWANN